MAPVTGGILRSRIERKGTGPRFGRCSLFSFRDGLATLPWALAERLSHQLRLGVRAERITPLPNGWFRVSVAEGNQSLAIAARSVLVALPTYATARLLVPLDDVAANALAVVFLGYLAGDVGHRLDGLGFLTPSREEQDMLGILFSSTLFAGRAPAGHVTETRRLRSCFQFGFARARARSREYAPAWRPLRDARQYPVDTLRGAACFLGHSGRRLFS